MRMSTSPPVAPSKSVVLPPTSPDGTSGICHQASSPRPPMLRTTRPRTRSNMSLSSHPSSSPLACPAKPSSTLAAMVSAVSARSGVTGATSTVLDLVSAQLPTLAPPSSTPLSGSSPVVSLTVPLIALLPATTLSAERTMPSSHLLRLVPGTRLTSRCFSRTLSPLSKRMVKYFNSLHGGGRDVYRSRSIRECVVRAKAIA